MPRRRHIAAVLIALPFLAAAPVGAEMEAPLLYEPRLYTPSVERMLVRSKADRIEARIRGATPPPSFGTAPLLPRPEASAFTSETDRRMAARAQASIAAAQSSAARELWSMKQDAALAELAETELWALHALRTFRPDPAAGPEGR